jgi:hypothetical protein
MSRKITFEFIIKFLEYDLLLKKLQTSSIHVEFYSLSNSFYFIIVCYTERKIYLCGGLQFQDLNAQKFGPPGDYWLLKLGTLKVKVGKIFAVGSDKRWKQLIGNVTNAGYEQCWGWDCGSGGGTSDINSLNIHYIGAVCDREHRVLRLQRTINERFYARSDSTRKWTLASS